MYKELELEYECCFCYKIDSDGTYWTDWEWCSKESALHLVENNPINSKVRTIYNGFKDE